MVLNKSYKFNNIGSSSAVTVGMFDGVHIGHQHLLKQLVSLSKKQKLVPVAVTFDVHPRVVLGRVDNQFGLLSTLEERLFYIHQAGIAHVEVIHFTPEEAALSACDFVKSQLVDTMNMKLLVLGYDNAFGNRQHNDFEQLPALAHDRGFTIYHDTAVELDGIEVSSTKIRHALQAGDVQWAQRMLGRCYDVTGRVVHGRHVGQSLGFPTANLELTDSLKALPQEGVYAVRVTLPDGSLSAGMVNVGPQPTFASLRPTVEVNIFNMSSHQELYGQQLTVAFVDRLRSIQRFDNAEQLIAQLHADKEAALRRVTLT